MRLYRQPAAPAHQVSDEIAAKFENDASRYWDMFYKRNATKFFKDRHYFDKEFPELLQGHLTVLEVGCGVGNTVFPLLTINPQLQVYACDFSPRAVQLVQEHPQYGSGRVKAFVADITQDELLQQLPGRCVDYCSMVFVLSAVAPEKMPQAIRNVASVLHPSCGRILFRDYAFGDLAQTRLEDGSGVKFIRNNFYARGDGTCCYYYSEDSLRALFAAEGFACESMVVHAKVIENKKLEVKMPRRWIQAVFRYAPEEVTAADRHAALLAWQQQWLQSDVQVKKQKVEGGQAVECSAAARAVSRGGSRGIIRCVGRQWQVPLDNSSSDGSPDKMVAQLQQAAAELEQLLADLQQTEQQQQREQQQQQSFMLHKQLLMLPQWLQLQQEQRQPADGHQAFTLLPHFAAVAAVADSRDSEDRGLYCQGVIAALLALVAVWLGARWVYVLSTWDGEYQTGVDEMLHLNESTVVCERIRHRVCAFRDQRHIQKLLREFKGQSVDFVIGQQHHGAAACARMDAVPATSAEDVADLLRMARPGSSFISLCKLL